jgi:hypothetical protein
MRRVAARGAAWFQRNRTICIDRGTDRLPPARCGARRGSCKAACAGKNAPAKLNEIRDYFGSIYVAYRRVGCKRFAQPSFRSG